MAAHGKEENGSVMFESVRKLIAEITDSGPPPGGRFDDNDYRLAAAALMVHAAGIDGNVSPKRSATSCTTSSSSVSIWTTPTPTN